MLFEKKKTSKNKAGERRGRKRRKGRIDEEKDQDTRTSKKECPLKGIKGGKFFGG